MSDKVGTIGHEENGRLTRPIAFSGYTTRKLVIAGFHSQRYDEKPARGTKRVSQNAHGWKSPRHPNSGRRAYVEVSLQEHCMACSSAPLNYMPYCLLVPLSHPTVRTFPVRGYWSMNDDNRDEWSVSIQGLLMLVP